MSKSLKNFITIKEILDEYTPFQIRMLYLTQPWSKSFNFRKDSLDKAKNSERYFLAFLSKVSTLATVSQSLS
jgi:cysteinyl-tRNA synthetase